MTTRQMNALVDAVAILSCCQRTGLSAKRPASLKNTTWHASLCRAFMLSYNLV